MSDPLNTGKPSLKRWEEFRAQYSAALLAHWVFRDLKADASEAVDDLWGRLQSSLCDYPELLQQDLEEGEDWNRHVPVHGRDPEDIVWLHVDDLEALYESLFPHDLQNASIESAMDAGAVVGLHSALDVVATAELLARLRAEFDLLGLPLAPTKAFSPASIGKSVLNAIGLQPPAIKAPSVTPVQMGQTMGAFHGGRAEGRSIRAPVPVVTVDFRSMYPTVNCLLGIWPVLKAETIRFEDYTEQFRTLIKKPHPNRLSIRHSGPISLDLLKSNQMVTSSLFVPNIRRHARDGTSA